MPKHRWTLNSRKLEKLSVNNQVGGIFLHLVVYNDSSVRNNVENMSLQTTATNRGGKNGKDIPAILKVTVTDKHAQETGMKKRSVGGVEGC